MVKVYIYHFLNMRPTLKHQDNINALNLSDCPKSHAMEKECEAFRYCFDTLEHPDTWVTQAEKLKREGLFPRDNWPSERLCDSWGLSFFDNERNAQAVWRSINSKMKQKLGYKNLSKGTLTKVDGVCSPIEHNGHFNLFEFEGCDLNKRFIIHSKL
jgi:hypothetical protein